VLEYAKKYEDELKKIFLEIAFDPYYKYECYGCYFERLELPDNTCEANHFVSIYNNNIIGLINYKIKRIENFAYGLHIVHFGGKDASNNYIFGKDIMTSINDIFEKYSFNKLSFDVIRGNPVEKTYDKLIINYGGRIVGIREEEIKLMDGKIYDIKEYEILSRNYYSNKISKK
jgi:hypothetical protein